MPAWARDLQGRDAEVAQDRVLPSNCELGAHQHHVHGQPAAALLHEQPLGWSKNLRRRLSRTVRIEEDPEALGIDPNRVAHGFDLSRALDRACEIELDV